MSYEFAVKLLDQVKDGALVPEYLITKALELTGDIEQPYS
jgi:hypothetical protein